MSVALLVMTDGRSYVHEAIASAEESLSPHGAIIERYLHDDSGVQAHAIELANQYPNYQIIAPHLRQGFGGAIQNAWAFIRQASEADYFFHLEDDFTFSRQVDLLAMCRLLDIRPNICQVALRRQAWNPAEKQAGGVVEMNPDAFVEHTFMEFSWMEHTEFFTTNPCMYRREMLSLTWPGGDQSEGRFGLNMKAVGRTFAYWGKKTDDPWVHHIGDHRIGEGY